MITRIVLIYFILIVMSSCNNSTGDFNDSTVTLLREDTVIDARTGNRMIRQEIIYKGVVYRKIIGSSSVRFEIESDSFCINNICISDMIDSTELEYNYDGFFYKKINCYFDAVCSKEGRVIRFIGVNDFSENKYDSVLHNIIDQTPKLVRD